MDLRKDLFTILDAAINSVKPSSFIKNIFSFDKGFITAGKDSFDLSKFKKVYVIGFGKASSQMAFEIENILGNKIENGFVVTNYNNAKKCRRIEVFEAGHPILDENSLRAGERMIEFVSKTGENDLIICLISGGGSALMEKLYEEISLKDFQTVSKLLINSGANIREINFVRRSLSEIKGGKLAEKIFPSNCINIVLSDIIGNPFEFIAGGPTVKPEPKLNSPWKIFEKYNLTAKIPAAIKNFLCEKITDINNADTHQEIFNKVFNYLAASNETALNAAKQKAEELCYEIASVKTGIEGEAKEIGKHFAQILKQHLTNTKTSSRQKCFLMGGETTVTVTGNGKGGRNQELILSALAEMQNVNRQFVIASIGTDGTDGPTDAAGAAADQTVINEMKKKQLNPLDYLRNNDSYNFFLQTGGLIKTGPTGTNVMDIVIGLIEQEKNI